MFNAFITITILVSSVCYLLRMQGMLIQLAAATAANGTKRPIKGGILYNMTNHKQNIPNRGSMLYYNTTNHNVTLHYIKG